MTFNIRLGLVLATSALCALVSSPFLAQAATIVDSWSTVVPPAPPAVRDVTVSPATTALLLLDFVKQTCSGPRCSAALPGVVRLLREARAAHVPVIYSYTLAATLADILSPVALLGNEPSVQAGPDKFLGTNLQQILTSDGIRTVIIAGTSAQGAVLSTASHAALIGYSVVVPIDAMPSEIPYAEQFVVWNLANAPQISASVQLTTIDRLGF